MQWHNCSAHHISCLKELVTNRCWFFMCLGSTNNRILLHTVILLIGRHETSITPSIWPEEAYWGFDWHSLCLPIKVSAAEAGASSVEFRSYSQFRDVIQRCDLSPPVRSCAPKVNTTYSWYLRWTLWSVPDEMWSLIGVARSTTYQIWFQILLQKQITDLYLDQNVIHSCSCSCACYC